MVRPRALTLAGALIVAAGLVIAWDLARNVPGIDFFQSWAGAQLAPAGERFYSQETRRGAPDFFRRKASAEGSARMAFCADFWRPEVAFVSTPFLYAAFALLPRNYDVAFLLYQLLSILAGIAAVVLLSRMAGLRLYIIFILLGFVLIAFQPLRADLRVGNVNQIQLMMVALWAWFAAREEPERLATGGVVLGLALCFKPNLLVLLPLLVARRLAAGERDSLRAEIAGIAGGALAAVVVSSIYFRSASIWRVWVEAARSIPGLVRSREMGNVAFALPLVKEAGPAANFILAAALVLIALLVIYRSRQADVPPHDLAGLATVIYLLSSPLVWYHYLVLSLPLAIALLGTSRYWPLAVAALSMVAADPWHWLFGIRATRYEAIIVNTGLCLLFVTTLVAIWRSASIRRGLKRGSEIDLGAT